MGLEAPSDNQLIELAKTGDKNAFYELYRRYEGKIFNYVYRFLGDRGKADEVTQDTFLLVYRHLHQYKPGNSAGPWIYRIAQNAARRYLRSEKHRKSDVSLDEVKADSETTLLDSLEMKGVGPEHEIRTKEFHEAIQKAIDGLPDKYRAVLILHDIEGVAYEEIQRILQIPYQTAATRLARARILFRQAIDPNKFGLHMFLFFGDGIKRSMRAMKLLPIRSSELALYVDGKLSAGHQENLAHYVNESPALKHMVTSMEEAKILLSHAPRLRPSQALGPRVMQLIENEPVIPAPWFSPIENIFEALSEQVLIMPRAMAVLLALGIAGALFGIAGLRVEKARIPTVVMLEGSPAQIVGENKTTLKQGDVVRVGSRIVTRENEEIRINRTDLFTLKIDSGAEAIFQKVSHVAGLGRNEILLNHGAIFFESQKNLSRGDLVIMLPNFAVSNRGTIASVQLAPDGSSTIAVLEGAVAVTPIDGSQSMFIIPSLHELTLPAGASSGIPQPISQNWLERLVDFSSERLVVIGLPMQNPAAALVDPDNISVAFAFFNISDSVRRAKMEEVRNLFGQAGDKAAVQRAKVILESLSKQYESENQLHISAPLNLFTASVSAYLGERQNALAILNRLKNKRYKDEIRSIAYAASGIIEEAEGHADLAKKSYGMVLKEFPESAAAAEVKQRLKSLKDE